MNNIKIIISYDGTRYFGWQKTKTGPSIQETLEEAISRLLGHDVKLEAASRTDRGVHANGQVVHFTTEKSIDLRKFLRGVNALLPRDISAQSIAIMPPAFHPTLDALTKEYDYFICNGPVQLPMHRLYSWHIPQALDLQTMEQSAVSFLGRQDFSAFTNAHYPDPFCEIHEIKISSLEDQRICIQIRGKRFLYKMARNIVGSLVYIGRGKLAPDSLPRLLNDRDRKKTGMTAPANGLFLEQVFYSDSQEIGYTEHASKTGN